MQAQISDSAPPTQVEVSQPTDSSPRVWNNFKTRQAKGLGLTQILLGVVCFFFQAMVTYGVGSFASKVGAGIWCGACFFITGIFGKIAAYSKTTFYIVTWMLWSILSVTISPGIMAVSSLGLALDKVECRKLGPDYRHLFTDYGMDCKNLTAALFFNSILIQIACVELVVGIWSAALCCSALYCGRSNNQTGMVLGQSQTVHSEGQSEVVVGGAPGQIASPQGQVAYSQD